MNLTTIQWVGLLVVFPLTWLVFVLGMAKLSKFYLEFIKFKKNAETNLSGYATNLRKMQVSMGEMVLEQRRANKLMLELIEKTGQMVYEYEIEEEFEEVPAGSDTSTKFEIVTDDDPPPIEYVDPPRPQV